MPKPKIILGIETSCDETAAAVLQKDGDRITILSNVVASSAELQSKYGGIIPEQAAREQIKSIIPVIDEALNNAQISKDKIDAIAVTQGPGLIGSLLVGVETAKTLSLLWKKPLIPVNHLIGHFYANWIASDKSTTIPHTSHSTPIFPAIGLLVSGGHSDIVLFQNHGKFKYLGGTRDDAAGECFDKCARLLSLPYPGGPQISKLAKEGNPKTYNLPRPLNSSRDLDFSFSGLKTAVSNLISDLDVNNPQVIKDLCASIEQAIIDCLTKKTILAIKTHKIENLIVAGGVAANPKLATELQKNCQLPTVNCKLFIPPPLLCTDNAAMIASAAFFIKPAKNLLDIQANPNLSLAY